MDESTPTKKAKPPGVLGAEIWVKVGDPAPVDPDEVTFLAVDTNAPYLAVYDGEDGGKNAHYMLRWINAKGEKGPVERDRQRDDLGVGVDPVPCLTVAC